MGSHQPFEYCHSERKRGICSDGVGKAFLTGYDRILLPSLKVQRDLGLMDVRLSVAHRWREGPLLRHVESFRI